jgi:aryl-alcohol dehydrogenase-like predicted oxidoreductase
LASTTSTSTTSTGSTRENAAAAELTLTAEQVEELDRAVSPDSVRGQRYDDSAMTLLDR